MGKFYVSDRWVARTVRERNYSSITKTWLANWAKEWEETRTETEKLLNIRHRELRKAGEL